MLRGRCRSCVYSLQLVGGQGHQGFSAGPAAVGPFLDWRCGRLGCRLGCSVRRRGASLLGGGHGRGGDNRGSDDCCGCNGSARYNGSARSTGRCRGAGPCGEWLGGCRRLLSLVAKGRADASTWVAPLSGLLLEELSAVLGRVVGGRRASLGAFE